MQTSWMQVGSAHDNMNLDLTVLKKDNCDSELLEISWSGLGVGQWFLMVVGIENVHPLDVQNAKTSKSEEIFFKGKKSLRSGRYIFF